LKDSWAAGIGIVTGGLSVAAWSLLLAVLPGTAALALLALFVLGLAAMIASLSVKAAVAVGGGIFAEAAALVAWYGIAGGVADMPAEAVVFPLSVTLALIGVVATLGARRTAPAGSAGSITLISATLFSAVVILAAVFTGSASNAG